MALVMSDLVMSSISFEIKVYIEQTNCGLEVNSLIKFLFRTVTAPASPQRSLRNREENSILLKYFTFIICVCVLFV